MSDLENFAAQEGQESDPQALEALREKMRANAQQFKKDKKQEDQQHKKEGSLAHIIVKFLQAQGAQAGNQTGSQEIMLLIVRCLEQNIPPVLVLAILLLTEHETLPTEEIIPDKIAQASQEMAARPTIYTNALTKIGLNEDTLPIKLKAEINKWIANIRHTADDKGPIVPQTLREPDGKIKVIAIQLTAFILRKFLSQHNLDPEYKKIQAFAHFTLDSVCKSIENKMTNNSLQEPEKE